MIDREKELLAALLARRPVDPTMAGSCEAECIRVGDTIVEIDWRTPKELGASKESWHSLTLRRMVPKGWVESRERPAYWRGPNRTRASMEYRITAKGAQALANAKLMERT